MLHHIKAQQFYTDLGLYQQFKVLQKINSDKSENATPELVAIYIQNDASQ